MPKIKPGTYAAHPEKLSAEQWAAVYENDKGNLILAQAFRIDNSGDVLKYWTALTVAGVPRERSIKDLRERYGWDGTDPFWFVDADLSAFPVELVIEDQPSKTDPTKVFSSIKWVNTPGKSAASPTVDRAAVMAKYGASFRALGGGTPVMPPKLTPPAPPKAPPPPPAAPVKPSSLLECWEKMNVVYAGDGETRIASEWAERVKATGKHQDDMTPADWGRFMGELEKAAAAFGNLPM